MNKKLISLIVVLSIISSSLLVVYAAQTKIYTDKESWSSADGTYSPDDGDVYCYSYEYSSENSEVRCRVFFSYDSDSITAIQNYYNNKKYYPGIDVTDMDKNLDHFWYETNLPDPHFDTDDDDYNGTSEETEVTCLSPLELKSGKSYNFKSYFDGGKENDDGTLEINSQLSKKSGSEYNTVNFDLLAEVTYKLEK